MKVNHYVVACKGVMVLARTVTAWKSWFVTCSHAQRIHLTVTLWRESLSIDHIHTAAVFHWHHSQGGKLKCCTAVFQVASPINVVKHWRVKLWRDLFQGKTTACLFNHRNCGAPIHTKCQFPDNVALKDSLMSLQIFMIHCLFSCWWITLTTLPHHTTFPPEQHHRKMATLCMCLSRLPERIKNVSGQNTPLYCLSSLYTFTSGARWTLGRNKL